MSILKELGTILKGVLMQNVPSAIQSGYHIGERVEYIDHSIRPVHQGSVVRTWNDQVKVLFDGFENGTWIEQEALKEIR